MYDEVILDKAVQIAAKNGWDGDIERSGYAPLVYNHDFCRALWGNHKVWVCIKSVGETVLPKRYESQSKNNMLQVEFEKPPSSENYMEIRYYRWHLWQMVWADDPIKYLSDNMP